MLNLFLDGEIHESVKRRHKAEIVCGTANPVVALHIFVANLIRQQIFLHLQQFNVGVGLVEPFRRILQFVTYKCEPALALGIVDNFQKFVAVIIDGMAQSLEYIRLRTPYATVNTRFVAWLKVNVI